VQQAASDTGLNGDSSLAGSSVLDQLFAEDFLKQLTSGQRNWRRSIFK